MGIGSSSRNLSSAASSTGGAFMFDAVSPIRKIFFDLDDTIMPCQDRYDSATDACLDLLCAEFGIADSDGRAELRRHMKATDAAAMLALKGKPFDIRRYENSWQRTYDDYAEKFGVEPREETRRELVSITEKPWNPPFDLYAGVSDTLRELSAKYPGVSLNILTMGDEAAQRIKLEAIPEDVRGFFESIVIVKDKTPEVMTKLFGRNPSQVLMVGNSEKSDINPALAVGAKALLIPNNTWGFMKEDVDEDHAAFRRVPDFQSILGL